MGTITQRFKKEFLLLVGFALILTNTLQNWVGNPVLYYPRASMKTANEIHEAILHNQLPPGKTWVGYGVNGGNTRIIVVYLAEFISKWRGKPILEVYYRLDSIFLFLIFIAFFFYLRIFLTLDYSLIGVCYLAFTFILSYHFHLFHPWDRISVVSWLIATFLLYRDRYVWLLVWMVIGTAIKYDIIMLSAVYGLFHFRPNHYRKAIVGAGVLFLTSFGVLVLLSRIFPDGFMAVNSASEPYHGLWLFIHIAKSNLIDFQTFRGNYPPLLAFTLPVIFSLFQIRQQERFVQSCAIVGWLGLVFYFFASRFVEVRAEIPLLILILPSALLSLKQTLSRMESSKQLTRSI